MEMEILTAPEWWKFKSHIQKTSARQQALPGVDPRTIHSAAFRFHVIPVVPRPDLAWQLTKEIWLGWMSMETV